MRISDWSTDVCSSALAGIGAHFLGHRIAQRLADGHLDHPGARRDLGIGDLGVVARAVVHLARAGLDLVPCRAFGRGWRLLGGLLVLGFSFVSLVLRSRVIPPPHPRYLPHLPPLTPPQPL